MLRPPERNANIGLSNSDGRKRPRCCRCRNGEEERPSECHVTKYFNWVGGTRVTASGGVASRERERVEPTAR